MGTSSRGCQHGWVDAGSADFGSEGMMMSNIGTHLEIEHKFVLEPGFDRDAFFHSVTALQPLRTHSAQVVERYYLDFAIWLNKWNLLPCLLYTSRCV